MKSFPWGMGVLLLFATAVAAAVGGLVSGGEADAWYAALSKPALAPPDVAFALVWPALFLLMIAGALTVLWRAGNYHAASGPLGIYYTMLAVNVAWSLAFFGFHEISLALGVMIALWLLIVAMIQEFWRYSQLAALLQVPYLVWVSFAFYLNAAIWFMN